MRQLFLTARRTSRPVRTRRLIRLHLARETMQRDLRFSKSTRPVGWHTAGATAAHVVRAVLVRCLGRGDGGFEDAVEARAAANHDG
jgi:hypothetical protein